MKYWILLAVACSTLCANPPERTETLSSKIVLSNADAYFVLSDRSCWKAVGFSKRWRSLSEWWNNVQLAPENYECVPNDWFLGAQIDAYPKYGNLDVSEANASNEQTLRQCTHLLVNRATGKTLFAIAMEPAECMMQLFRDAQREGYDQGYEQGRRQGYQNSTEIYNQGHAAGYQSGYTAGYRDSEQHQAQPGSRR